MSGLNGTKINLDHLYCHPIDNNYITTTTTTTNTNNTNPDIFKIFTENKQLKSMLLLHLDLIQEQSDQLINKEKNIAQLKQENDILKQKIDRMNQKIRQQKQLKLFNNSANCIIKENNLNTAQQILEKNNEKWILDNNQVNINNNLNNLNQNDEKPDEKNFHSIKINENINKTIQNNQQYINSNNNNNNNNKSILKLNICNDDHSSNSSSHQNFKTEIEEKSQSNDDNKLISESEIKTEPEFTLDNVSQSIPNSLINSYFNVDENSIKFDSDSLSNSNGKTLEINENDENVLEYVTKDILHNQTSMEQSNNDELNLRGNGIKRKRIHSEPTSVSSTSNSNELEKRRTLRGNFMTTKNAYTTRAWNTDEIDEEFKQINENLSLEIPSWVVKECAGCYSIEGTEDLSEETFLKRHQKYEIDERRRKKWDVQRIREQRTIERLKRRHCKKELQEENDEMKKKENTITSFYYSSDSIKFIEVTEEIPVQAFGENIPKLPPSEFSLPWHTNYHNNRIQFSEKSSLELIKKLQTKRKYTKSTGSQQK